MPGVRLTDLGAGGAVPGRHPKLAGDEPVEAVRLLLQAKQVRGHALVGLRDALQGELDHPLRQVLETPQQAAHGELRGLHEALQDD